MSLFFGKKEQLVIELFNELLDSIENTIIKLQELISEIDREKQKELAEEVRKLETTTDHIRRKAEHEMYTGAFLPNFRGDLLGTIEALDRIANKAEAVADEIDLQDLEIPEELLENFKGLIEKSLYTYRALKEAAKEMFEDFDKAGKMIDETEKYEHETDEIERETIRKIYSLDIPLAEKMQLKELVHRIADISDTSEDVSDRIQIILYKRKV